MIPIELQETSFYQELDRRSVSDKLARMFSGLLLPISGDAQAVLEYIKMTHPTFTDHSIQHSWRVLNSISGVLKSSAIEKLSSIEIFCLIMAALFHDAGMAYPKADRSNHNVLAKEVIHKYFEEKLAIISELRLANYVAFIAEAHGLDWSQMVRDNCFSVKDTIKGQQIRVSYLAVLLRIGDLLDLDSDRSIDFYRRLVPNVFDDTITTLHQEKHSRIKQNRQDSDRIEIRVTACTKEEDLLWRQWFSYLKNDILRANTYIFNITHDFQLPPFDEEVTQAEEANYELISLKFDIDEKGRLWDIISRSVYTGQFDFVRELLQNGIDACLMKMFLTPEANIEHISPVTWNLNNYKPHVYILSSEKQKKMVVIDNGIGMGIPDLQSFLLKVADTGFYLGKNDRPFPFPSIAKFGIGFISTLVRARRIIVETRRQTSQVECGYRVLLYSDIRDAYLERQYSSEKGTKIVLDLKYEYKTKDIIDYLVSTFHYPSVEVSFVHWDNVVSRLETSERSLPYLDVVTHSQITELASQLIINSEYFNLKRNFETTDLEPIIAYLDGEQKVNAIEQGIYKLNHNRSGVIWVPVSFVDHDLGIEWASLHGFLFAKGSVKRTLIKVLKYDDYGNEIEDFALIVDDTDDLEEEIELGYQQRYYDDYEELDVYELENERLAKENHKALISLIRLFPKAIVNRPSFEVDYWQIALDEFSTEEKTGVDLFSVSSLTENAKVDRKTLKKAISGDLNLRAYLKSSRESDSLVFDFHDLVRLLNKLDGSVFQDGIRLPLDVADIVPLGTVRGLLNLNANARFELNVTRNSIDESPEILQDWIRRVGEQIQVKVVENVTTFFLKLGLDFSLDNLVIDDIQSHGMRQQLVGSLAQVIRDRQN